MANWLSTRASTGKGCGHSSARLINSSRVILYVNAGSSARDMAENVYVPPVSAQMRGRVLVIFAPRGKGVAGLGRFLDPPG
jgi:hypothetical protein